MKKTLAVLFAVALCFASTFKAIASFDQTMILSHETYNQVKDFEHLRDISLALLGEGLIEANGDGSVTIRQLLEETTYKDGSVEQLVVADTLLFLDQYAQTVRADTLHGTYGDNESNQSDNWLNLFFSGGLLRGVYYKSGYVTSSTSKYDCTVYNRTYMTVQANELFNEAVSVTLVEGWVLRSPGGTIIPEEINISIVYNKDAMNPLEPYVSASDYTQNVNSTFTFYNPNTEFVSIFPYFMLYDTGVTVYFSNGQPVSANCDVKYAAERA